MRWISSIGGIIATSAAVAVLVSLPTVPPHPDAVSSPIEETTSTEAVPQIVTGQPVERDLGVPDLGEDLTDVLAESGYTQFVGATELSETLSDDVVQVLIREEAVLVIPSSEER